MENNLGIITTSDIFNKTVNVYGTFEEPLFLAKDVADWIGLTNVTDMVSRVDSGEVTKLNLGGLKGECNFLTEDGLYEVLMQSRKPIAKKFKGEIKKMLKNIRRSGGISINNWVESEYIKSLEVLTESLKELVDIQKKYIDLTLENRCIKDKLLEYSDKPKKLGFIEVEGNGWIYTPSNIAKAYGMYTKEFNSILCDLGVQRWKNNQWELTKEYSGNGYTSTCEFKREDGTPYNYMRWTRKGVGFVIKVLHENGFEPSKILNNKNTED